MSVMDSIEERYETEIERLNKYTRKLLDENIDLSNENAARNKEIARLKEENAALRADNAAWATKHFEEMSEKDRDSLMLRQELSTLTKEIAALKIDLSKPPQEREYCAGCSLLTLTALIERRRRRRG